MKKTKKLLALVVVFALVLAGVITLVACKSHECNHVCTTCGKCTDMDCADPACAEKCAGHGTVQPHVCGHVCSTCGKCTDATCTNAVCADKCAGHGTVDTHVCGHVCATCGKCLDATCTNAVCADKCAGHSLPAVHECEHKCEVCGKCATNCADPECADKCECEGYTITVVVGDGVLEEGTPTTYKTDADGKLIGLLPVPEKEHWALDDWYDAETGGNAIVEATTVFTEDANVYARYIREDGVWIGDTFKHALSINGGNADRTEYWLGGDKITLAKDDVINLYIDGKLVSHHVEPNSAGVVKPASGTAVTEVTVKVAGEFAIYLHKNDSDWSCEYSGPTEVNESTEIPEGCDAFKVTIGTNVITFYLKDSSGNPVAAADFSKFCIYTYSDEIFGNWAGSTTKGVLSANMTGTGTAIPEGWIFRWGSGYSNQTSNIIGVFKNGGTYVVELPATSQSEATITEIAMKKNTVTIDLNYEGQPEEKATLEAVGGKVSALPTEPTRDDYDFVGWFTAAVDGDKVTLDTEYTEDTTIYAHWTAKIQVTVNYNYEDCAEPIVVKATKGKLTALPTAPVREGYYLVGWFTAATEGTKITVNYVFTEDTTIYAQWGVRVDATVTINYGNYEGAPQSETISISAANGNLITPFPTAPAREGYKFLGWYTTAVDTEEVIGELVTEETEIHENITIYARYATLHTLTIVVGAEGSLPAGAATTYEILDGKVQFPEGTTGLPTVTVAKEHWSFKGWYKGTTAVNVATAVFEEDTTLTAKIVRDDGVWKGETFVRALTVNTGNTERTEYWLGGVKITLAKGDKISLYIGGIIINHYVEPNSAGIVKPAASALVSEVTVDVAGEMAIYLHRNASDWSCEYSGPTEVIVGSDVPIGCDMFTVTMGTNKINFFLKDASGKAVSSADFSKFCIYTYETEIFGNWATSATKGVLSENMTGSGSAVPNGWIFRWGSSYGQQTSNLVGAFKAGKTYLVELKGHQQGATITELTITSTYTITFDQNYEGQPETKVTGKAYNGKLTNLYTFTREGYADKDLFWYTAAEGGEKVTYNTVFTADTTIYARWSEKVKITPNLNYEDADAMAAITVNLGQLSTMPANPTRAGYEFLGWFTLAEGGDRVTTSTVFEADSQIYAHWRVPFKVTFDLNYTDEDGNSPEAEVKTANVVAGETYSKLTSLGTNPVREGYEFLGWFTLAEGGDRVTVAMQYTGDTTIYAHWRVPFVVTFDYNYGDDTSPEATKANASVVSGQTYSRLTSAQITTPVRDGYDFLGWYPNADGTGAKLTTSTNIEENVTYYASWRRPIEVTFDLNYTGAAEPTKKNATLVAGQTYSRFATADIPVPERDGYDFLGWYPNADGSGSKLIYTTNLTENVTYYASWRRPIEVTLDLNYTGAAEPTKVTATLQAGTVNSRLTADQFADPTARDGYDFLGWFSVAETTGGTKLSTTTNHTENTTYYARWKEIVKVTFDLNYEGADDPTVVNAAFYSSTATASYSRLTAAQIVTPVRTGYDFVGWYNTTAASGGSTVSASTNLSASVTYYARWTVGKTVTFNLNYDGQPTPMATATTTNKLITLPENPTREGYEFKGWFTTATGSTAVTATRTYTANTTIYAQWTALPVVTFDLNDGEEHETNATLTVNAEKKLTAFITEPTRDGYTFAGWFTAEEEGEQVTLEKVYTADTTVYAHWTAVTPELPETDA